MVVGAVTPAKAIMQHDAYVRILIGLGARVIELPFVHGAHDSVFTKDAAVLIEQRERRAALIARPRHAERTPECDVRAVQLRELGFDVHRARSIVEGGDVLLRPDRGFAVLGTGIRSCASAAHEVEVFAGLPVTVVKLVDPALFHLDIAMAVLSDGTALVCPEAFSRSSMAAIERLPLRELVDVTAAEARQFALNFVEVGNAVVKAGPEDRVSAQLRKRGREVRLVELDEFHFAGGSAACLVARLVTDVRYSAAIESAA